MNRIDLRKAMLDDNNFRMMAVWLFTTKTLVDANSLIEQMDWQTTISLDWLTTMASGG